MPSNNVLSIGVGRPRTPSGLRAYQTSDTRAEPRMPCVPVPPPPKHLDKAERAIWARMKAIVDPLHIFSEVDVFAFQNMVSAVATLEAADAVLRREGLTMLHDTGRSVVTKVRPEVAIKAKFHTLVMVWCAKFGISPSDRSRVTSLPDKDRGDPTGRREKMAQFGG